MFNPIFHGSLSQILSTFMASYLFCIYCIEGVVLKIRPVRPLLLGARMDCGSEREHGLLFSTMSQCNTCGCLLTF